MRIARLKLISVATVLSLAALSHAPAALAACATNSANLGQVTGQFTLAGATTQSYRVWSRISVPDLINNSYTLEIDGTQCNITVGDNLTTINNWAWVDYGFMNNSSTSGKLNITLAAGSHTYVMYGREPNVKVDRVLFVADTTCVPSGTGDNCLLTPQDTQAPTTPTNLTSPVKTETSVTLSWTASTDNIAVTGYRIYRDGTFITMVNTPATTFTDTGLTAATNYNYQISAVDAVPNESAKTAALGVITNIAPPPPDTQAPSVPTGLALTSKTSSSVAFLWSASTDNVAVTGYRIYRSTGSGTATQIGTTAAGVRSFTDTSVISSTTYNYQVTAIDAIQNESSKSLALTVVTDASVTIKVGDFNKDGIIDYKDMSALLSQYGVSNSTYDLNNDNIINYKDMSVLLSKYGT